MYNLKPQTLYFSNSMDAQNFADQAKVMNPNFKMHSLGYNKADRLYYTVVHTYPKRHPRSFIKKTYDRLVRRSRRFDNIYLGD